MQCRDHVHLHRLAAQKPRYTTWSPTLASAFLDKHFSQRKNYFQRILFSQRKIKNCVLVKLPKAIKTVIITECSKWLGLLLSVKNMWSHCSARISTYVRASDKQGSHLLLTGMLVGKLKSNPYGRPMWVCRKLKLTPRGDHTKTDITSFFVDFFL